MTEPLDDRLQRIGEIVKRNEGERARAEEDPPIDPELAREFQDLDRDVENRGYLERVRQWEYKMPSRFAQARLDDLAGELRREIDAWLAMDPLPNLVLVGPVGTGKSHAAVATARELWVDGMMGEVRRFFLPTLLDRLDWRQPDHADVMANVKSARILVLDDLGSSPLSEWALGRVGSLVNERWERERLTIVTTNLQPEPLKAAVGERIYSRLLDGATMLAMGGDDRRLAT